MKHLLITGSPRSGTTYVGDVVRRAGKFRHFHEPFNAYSGMADVAHWFPYASVTSDTAYNDLVDRFMGGDFRYRTIATQGSYLLNLVRSLLGNKAQLRSALYRAGYARGRPLLIKDPLAVLSSRYFAEKHGVKIVAMVRHPAAFSSSMQSRNWNFDFENLLSQEPFLRERRPSLPQEVAQIGESFHRKMALLWHVIYACLLEDMAADSGKYLFVRHEDLCADPDAVFRKIFEFAGVEMTEDSLSYIRKTTNADQVQARDGATHDFYRNARLLAGSWRKSVPAGDLPEIRKITESVSSRFYGAGEW